MSVSCRVCLSPVPVVAIGRPRTYCSLACRRQMAAMRAELPVIEEAIIRARQQAAWGNWPGTRSWTAEADWLELAAAELRQRIGHDRGEVPPPIRSVHGA